MEAYRLNLLPFMLLSAFIISAAKSEATQIVFPQFSANDSSIISYGDVLYNQAHHSYILNANSDATSRPSCAILSYAKADLNIEDIQASFTTSFTFRFTTPPQQPVWDDFNVSELEFGTRMSFAIGNSVDNDWLAAWANQSGPCINIPGDNSYVGVVFGTDYNYRIGEPSNNFIGISDGNDNNPAFGAGTTYNLCGENIDHCSFFANGASFTAWIDYTPEQTLEVRLLNGSFGEKPVKALFEYPNFKLPPALGEYISPAIVGSSAANHITAHEVLAWSFNTTGVPKVHFWHKRWVPLLGVGGTMITFLLLCMLFWWLARRSSHRRIDHSSGIRVFLYKELRQATKNFSESEKIGSGGFGIVYRGSFGDVLVAIKRINMSKHAEMTFLAEVSSLGLIKHRNVVQLQGWCHEKGRLLLVYDYMPNGNLNEWLHESGSNHKNKPILPWKLRHQILEEVAAALEYLHSDCVQCILHRDIKSSNVMLDAKFKAHLGDFGLARLMDHQKHDRTTMAAGTLGYMAPEMPYTGKATKESDVYSFGILVLEVVCGRQPLDLKAQQPEDVVLLYTVWQAQEAGTLLSMADPRLLQPPPAGSEISHNSEPMCTMQTEFSASHSHSLNDYNMPMELAAEEVEVERTIKNLLELGLMCCLPNPKARPTMGQVMQILQQINDIDNVDHVIISMPPLPKTKPLGLYSSMEFSQTATSSFSLGSLPIAFSSGSESRYRIDEVRDFL